MTPNVTRAGTASGLIQKLIQDIITIRQVGMYVWNMKYLHQHWYREGQ